jgi:hypothetical protein
VRVGRFPSLRPGPHNFAALSTFHQPGKQVPHADSLLRRVVASRKVQQIAAVRAKLREALEHGDRPARKRLLQSVVAEIRVYSRHKIQTYFRLPGTNDAPEGAVRARVPGWAVEDSNL